MTRVNKKNFLKALPGTFGNQVMIANRLGVVRSTITEFLKRYPEMKIELEDESERIIDISENVIHHDIVVNKSVDTAKWKLSNSRRGKAKGYGLKTQTEVTGAMDNKLEVEIIEVIKNEDEITDNSSIQKN